MGIEPLKEQSIAWLKMMVSEIKANPDAWSKADLEVVEYLLKEMEELDNRIGTLVSISNQWEKRFTESKLLCRIMREVIDKLNREHHGR